MNQPTITYFVSPSGKDSNPGTEEHPFATIAHARDELRRSASDRIGRRVTVYLRGGIYRLTETVVFTPEDSGSREAPVTYAAYPGEKPVLSGGATVGSWRLLGKALPGLPSRARGKVWTAPLDHRIAALFDRQGLLTRAHSPHLSTVKEEADPKAPGVPEGVDPEAFTSGLPIYRELRFKTGDLRDWSNLRDVEIFLTPRNPWTVNYLGIESVDMERGIARTDMPSTYPITTAYGPEFISRVYRIENVIDYLDAPGTWVSDTETGTLYLWPRDGEPEGIVAPVLTELVKFEGDDDNRRWVRDIVLSGLTFSHGDRMRFRPGRRSLQHDWEQEDEANALVRLRGTERIRIKHCRFTDSGSSGIRLDLHAVDNAVANCEIAGIGGIGISLVGFGPGTRDENHHNTVTANHIHHTGRLWWHSAGVFIAQSGHNRISDNLIDHVPYCALVMSGPRMGVLKPGTHRNREGSLTIRRDELGESPYEWPVMLGFLHARYNVVEHNEIHHAMELLGDGNGIYISGTGVGNTVRRNYVHDIEGMGTVSGIRLDDEEYYTLVTENVVFRICGAGILTKNINQVENNIIVDCYGPRQFGYLAARHRGPCHGTGIRRNLLVRLPRERKEPFFVFGDTIGFLHQVSLDDNLLYDYDDPAAAGEALAAARGWHTMSRGIVANPGFRDAANGDFRVEDGSPVVKTGFRPFDQWGPRTRVGP